MNALRLGLAVLLLALPLRALAQDDEDAPRPRSDDDSGEVAPAPRKQGKKSKPRHTETAEEELSEEPDPALRKMAREDDPRLGLGVELALSLALLDKAGGPGVQSIGAAGFRFNWAPGVLWTDPEDEFWRYALLVELSYDYSGYSDGTKVVNTSTRLHYLNAHAMFGYPASKVLLFYGALGPGMTVESIAYHVATTDTPLTAVKFNLAYGLGARLNFPVSDRFAFVSRMELMRYRRGYLNDTFLTFSLGGAF